MMSVTKIPAQLEAALVREALLKKQVAELQAENVKLRAHDKARDESFEVLRAENNRMLKAILSWWSGSPEDTCSEVKLRSLAKEMGVE